MSAPAPLLRTRSVTKRFGGLTAVKALDMEVSRGALYGLIRYRLPLRIPRRLTVRSAAGQDVLQAFP